MSGSARVTNGFGATSDWKKKLARVLHVLASRRSVISAKPINFQHSTENCSMLSKNKET